MILDVAPRANTSAAFQPMHAARHAGRAFQLAYRLSFKAHYAA